MRENHRPTLPKWPFYFGDIFLVSIAIVLAFQGEGPLTAWQFFWCFLTVATGAALFALPFIIEFNGHIKMSQRSDSGNNHELARRLEATIYELQDMKETTLSQGNKQSVANTMLETSLKNVDARLAKLVETQKTFNTFADEFKTGKNNALALQNEETLLAVNNKLDQLIQQQGTATSEAFETLTLQLQELLAQLETKKPTQANTNAHTYTSITTTRSNANTGQVTQTPEGKKVFDIQNLTHSPQDCFLEETSNAFPTGMDILTDPGFDLDVNSAKNEFQGLIPQAAKHEQQANTQAAPKPLKEWHVNKEEVEEESTSLKTEIQEQETAQTFQAIPQETAIAEGSNNTDMPLFQTSTATAVASQPKTNTTLTANVMTGIGKKPYLRGEGPGLSWERGIPMDFVEIGKWQWATTETDQPITCQIYKNDETPAEGGAFTINAGQTLEVNPTFSS